MGTEQKDRNLGAWWLFPLLLGLVFFGILGGNILTSKMPKEHKSSNPVVVNKENHIGRPITLVIDFGRESESFSLVWKDGATVYDLMLATTKNPGGLQFKYQGSGKSAFLTEINGMANGAQNGHFWQYWVNDRRAEESFGVYLLKPGDRVLWKFAPEG